MLVWEGKINGQSYSSSNEGPKDSNMKLTTQEQDMWSSSLSLVFRWLLHKMNAPVIEYFLCHWFTFVDCNLNPYRFNGWKNTSGLAWGFWRPLRKRDLILIVTSSLCDCCFWLICVGNKWRSYASTLSLGKAHTLVSATVILNGIFESPLFTSWKIQLRYKMLAINIFN